MPGAWQMGQVVIETLAPGGACRIAVAMPSDGQNWVDGFLSMPDGTARGTAYSRLRMQPTEGPTEVVLTGTPERGSVTLSTSAENTSYRVLRAQGGSAEQVVATAVPMPWRDSGLTEGSSYAYRVVSQTAAVDGEPSNQVTVRPYRTVDRAEGTFMPVEPVRLVDTRSGLGGRTGKLGVGGVMTVDPGLHVPDSDVSAVLLNVTGTEPTSSTFLAVAPTVAGRPATSNVNLVPGQTRPNQVVVPVVDDGTVQLYNNSGSTHVIVDLQGFYSAANGVEGGGYHFTWPLRALDTREWEDEPLLPGEEIWVPIDNAGLREDASAVVVNLTVTEPTTPGHLVAWPGDGPAPTVSNANFAAGQTVANHAVVPVAFDEDGNPGIALRNSQGRTHVIVDVLGWYDDGTWSDGLGASPARRPGCWTPARPAARSLRERLASCPAARCQEGKAHAVNLTATESVSAGWARAWSGQGSTTPSTLNFVAGEDSPHLATPGVNSTGGFAHHRRLGRPPRRRPPRLLLLTELPAKQAAGKFAMGRSPRHPAVSRSLIQISSIVGSSRCRCSGPKPATAS